MGKRGPKPGSPRLIGMQRVAGKYTINSRTSCWEWSRYCNEWGYGVLGILADRVMLAHRFVWEQLRGPIPNGLCVLHRCDNPPCINVDHLFLGTDADNCADKISKGRQVILRGEAHGCAKLTLKQVQELRLQFGKLSDCELGRRYGVHSVTIRCIRIGKTWKSA